MIVEHRLANRLVSAAALALACAAAAITTLPKLARGESAEQVPVFEQDVLPILKRIA